MMKLRPHHLLCLQKYTGRGYDGPFTAHMNELVRRLTADPQEPVQLTQGRDDVCVACPHLVDGRCASQEKVTHMDRGVLGACGFAYGQVDSWRALAVSAENKIFQTEQFNEICGSCQWIELCRGTRKGWIDGNEA